MLKNGMGMGRGGVVGLYSEFKYIIGYGHMGPPMTERLTMTDRLLKNGQCKQVVRILL